MFSETRAWGSESGRERISARIGGPESSDLFGNNSYPRYTQLVLHSPAPLPTDGSDKVRAPLAILIGTSRELKTRNMHFFPLRSWILICFSVLCFRPTSPRELS